MLLYDFIYFYTHLEHQILVTMNTEIHEVNKCIINDNTLVPNLNRVLLENFAKKKPKKI